MGAETRASGGAPPKPACMVQSRGENREQEETR